MARTLFSLLLIATLLLTNPLVALAEPSAPTEANAGKPNSALQLYAAGLQMAPLLPKLLGFSEPQTYMLLVQNNHELRATGGFITAVGRVTVDKGRVTELVINDSYDIKRNDVDHPLAPEPFKKYMNIEILFIRDINWSPDFPTTARLASSLYAQDAGVQVDGVISVDLRAVEIFVDALAPLQIPGSDVVLTGDNIMDEIMHMWDRPLNSEVAEDVETDSLLDRKDWLEQRKDFIPMIAEAAIERLQKANFNPLMLISSATTALNERAVQVWLEDPAAADLMEQYGWDGGLHPEPTADYLALVDTNMGYNKADAVMERTLTYTVTWPAGPTAPAQATTIVTYHHPWDVTDASCSPWTDYGELDSYMGMIGRCYFDYVRLYVPGGSELIAIEGVEADSVIAQGGEKGTEVFAGYLSFQPGQTHTVTFTYTLPPRITVDNYRLVLQRQAGVGPMPVEIAVDDTAFALTLEQGLLVWPAATPAEAD